MNKQAPTRGQIAAMVAFAVSCFGLMLFLWVSFGGTTPLQAKGYRIHVQFRQATQLATEAEVRVAGVAIGRVADKEVAPGPDGLVDATLEIDPEYVPIRRDARAILREKTLLGETYVEITLGTGKATLPDGGRLALNRVQPTVKLDEILDTFDPYTRAAFRTWQQTLGKALDERGGDLNDAVGNLPGFVESAGDLVETLDRNRADLRGLVRNTGVVFEALTADERQLARLVTGGDRTFSAIARRKEAFAEVFQELPPFLRESRRTSAVLEGFSGRATPVLREVTPALQDTASAVGALGRSAPDLDRFLQSITPLEAASKAGLPASTEIFKGLRPALQSAEPFLGELNPLLGWIGQHSYTLTDMFSNLGVATAAKTASRDPKATGHYLRQYSLIGTESLGGAAKRIASNRGNAYLNPLALTGRVTGEAGIFPAWDCANATPNVGPPCRIDPGYRFQDQLRRFPHVQSETYRSGRAKPTGK
ncbi:hypothetical protein DSM112329_02494 [Paraconexibacter sp. AEG42_29]|uniref:Mce/MlaD domain-containing protein n=1 Tax=Paraconexibacter sp. AEG42_29 TaxID=2997339 RepID=A0AAU7AWC8_9ACTN